MTDYKFMCKKLLTAHYVLKRGLTALCRLDKYGELKEIIQTYCLTVDEITKPASRLPKTAKVRHIRGNRKK